MSTKPPILSEELRYLPFLPHKKCSIHPPTKLRVMAGLLPGNIQRRGKIQNLLKLRWKVETEHDKHYNNVYLKWIT